MYFGSLAAILKILDFFVLKSKGCSKFEEQSGSFRITFRLANNRIYSVPVLIILLVWGFLFRNHKIKNHNHRYE